MGSKVSDISLNNIFSDISPWARETNTKINKWDYIKLKCFCTAKKTINNKKRQPTEWEKIFTNDTSDRVNIQNLLRAQTTQHQKNKKTQLKIEQKT